ncbi:hydroxylamine reductase [Pseudomaricurvus alkylphenolicus]|uniref:hydroxylamine reductase n=1 Tax=Pseudomaricurvus alkylphenolicus TaxID=1306991 RepID=UPI001424224A|nr:hydroxylamine reductase [Pseudomaricurvus alkylphenolicus]NIB38280.1 hydroxylamine reductase [Pseudomaricurvus alkylphenolicus]
MFCIQCEQTQNRDNNPGCQLSRGLCGKEAETADLQDLLNYILMGISMYAHRARALGAADADVDHFVAPAFFTTLTNVNFDADRFVELIGEAIEVRAKARNLYTEAAEAAGQAAQELHGPATWLPTALNRQALQAQAHIASIAQGDTHEDIFAMQCLLIYGLKGCCAYYTHALEVGKESEEIYAGIHQYMDFIASKSQELNALIEAAMGIGNLNLKVMALLDEGNTDRFGHPVPTQVRVTPVKGKAILVSGHDLQDLHELLKQIEGKGINIYTHGEMLPAHGYPELKAYSHLVGNYGGAWQDQQKEFANFPGAILMTSNCLLNPNVGGYQERIFTAGPVGWNGIGHIENRNFAPLIEAAVAQPGFAEDQIEQFVSVGFARNSVLGAADKVIDGVKSGAIKHFFLIGGCDGAKPGRNYFTEFAEQTPDDTVMLTLGCGKFRFNKQQHGDIGGIPRLLDVGQCNDAYSAIQIAVALADAFDCEVNDLPLTLIVSWFEQKAAAVLLSLLALGIKNIHLGPSLPPYLSPTVVNFLVETFDLKPTGNAQQDMEAILKAS